MKILYSCHGVSLDLFFKLNEILKKKIFPQKMASLFQIDHFMKKIF